MSRTLRTVPFGPEATDLLAELVTAAKAGDALAPVTVVAPRLQTSLALRRTLAGRPPGVANVAFRTVEQLVGDLLASGAHDLPALSRPMTPTVRLALAERVLEGPSGEGFGPGALHPSTAKALAEVAAELDGVATRRLTEVARGRGTDAPVLSAVLEMRRLASGTWSTGDERIEAACAILRGSDGARGGAGPGGWAPMVVFLPGAAHEGARRAVEAFGEVAAVTVVLGLTGDPEVDRAQAEAWGPVADPDPDALPASGPLPVERRAERVVSASNADAEVLHVVRAVASRCGSVHPGRIAVITPAGGGATRRVLDELARHGVPASGVSVETLDASPPGRLVLGVLAAHEAGWTRASVAELLASPALVWRGGSVRADAWARAARLAGVVEGSDWDVRLAELEAALGNPGHVLARELSVSRWRPERVERVRRDARDLRELVGELRARCTSLPGSWPEWSAWLVGLVRDLVAAASEEGAAGVALEESTRSVVAVAEGLVEAEPTGLAPTVRNATRLLANVLASRAPQTARFGTGVVVGPAELVAGMELDSAFVVDMVDGLVPGRRGDDPLLPERDREAIGQGLALRRTRRLDERRAHLAAIAGASHIHLSYARGDQRDGGAQRPSRWLLDQFGALSGRTGPAYARDLAAYEADPAAHVPEIVVLRSYEEAVARSEPAPASLRDLDLRDLTAWTRRGGAPARHPLVAAARDDVARAFHVREQRRRPGFTRFDGNVGDGLGTDRWLTSATALEIYARCPRRFLFERHIDLELVAERVGGLEVSGADVGTLVHGVLERFFSEAIARHGHDPEEWPLEWESADRDRIADIFDEECGALEADGLLGHPVLWATRRPALLADLDDLLDAEAAFRREHGCAPVALERPVAPEGRQAEVYDTGHRTLLLRGSVDRVDHGPDGSSYVIDWKTGSDRGYGEFDEDPFARGTRLQLGLYGEAIRNQDRAESVTGVYWFTRQGGAGRLELPLDTDRRAELDGIVDVLAEGIAQGHFPARPGAEESNCTWCEVSHLCPTIGREENWEAVSTDPALARYVALVDGDGGADDDGAVVDDPPVAGGRA